MSDSKTRVVAIGAILPGGKPTILASAAQFNHGKEGVVMLPEYDVAFISGEMYEEKIQEILGKRTAEVGLNPDDLSPVAAAAYAETVATRHDDIHGFAAMLDALRAGDAPPLEPMSDEVTEAINNEWIGMEQSTTGGHFQ